MKAILVGLLLSHCKRLVFREILIRQVDKGVHIFVEVAPKSPLFEFNKRQNQEKNSHKYEKFLAISQPLRRTISKQTAEKTHPFALNLIILWDLNPSIFS
jgi:hypothetical protein